MKLHIAVSHAISDSSTLESQSRNDTALSAAILCSAVSVSDVKVGFAMLSKSIRYITNQLLLLFSCSLLAKSQPMCLRSEEFELEAKATTRKKI